jgi:hypothetical protein
MPALGNRFKKERIRIREIKDSIELMEARKKLESPSVIDLLDKNIGYCKKQLNTIILSMIEQGYKGEGL